MQGVCSVCQEQRFELGICLQCGDYVCLDCYSTSCRCCHACKLDHETEAQPV